MSEPKILTVVSYGEKPGETYRVTPQAMNIAMISASEQMVSRQGVSVYEVDVLFMDGGEATLFISKNDLQELEEAVGFLCLEDF